jgi:hypothetical protein
MSKKKTTKSKKTPPTERGLIDQVAIVIDHILSYFQIFFIYLRKKFNHNLQKSIVILFIFLYLFILKLAGTGFLIHSLYLVTFQHLQDPIQTSLSIGLFLFSFSILFMYFLLKKIVI